jgi:phosphatidylglycerol:prolipoprotein diacylglycerol transferase
VYPILFRLGDFEVTTFGALVALAALAGLWIFHRELVRSGLPPDGVDAALVGVLGGLAGAKLIWAIEFRHTAPFLSLLLSRGGLSWFGGFLGGVGAGLWSLHRRRIPLLRALAAAAPALAVGHAIGRIGCFMVGDDYGRPTDLPWGVAFPRGLPPTTVPVHPTQLYETAGLAVIAWLLIRWRRAGVADAIVFGRYLFLAGALRFLIEFVRINAPLAGTLTLAQLFSVAIMATGLWFMRSRQRSISRGRAGR